MFENHLFRCHYSGELMTEPREKSPKERHGEAVAKAENYKADLSLMKEGTKPYDKKKLSLQKAEIAAEELKKQLDLPFLSETCLKRLRQIHRETMWNRKKELNNKFLRKGLECEKDSFTAYTIFKKGLFMENKERLENKWLTGLPDSQKKVIEQIGYGFDIKTSWDVWTFPYGSDELAKVYFWQNQAYMDLTCADKWATVHVLVNALPRHILAAKWGINNTLGQPDGVETHENFDEYCEKVLNMERNMIVDMVEFKKKNPTFDTFHDENNVKWEYDIPLEQRIREVFVDRDEEAIERIHSRIEECRAVMETF